MSVKTYPEPTDEATLKDLRPIEKVALGVAVFPSPTPDAVLKNLLPSLVANPGQTVILPGPTYLTSPIAESDVTNLVSDLALKAPLASPTFTGTPAAPTPSANDNSTKLATTAYVDSALATFDIKPDVAYASTSALPANTYNNGASGVGATLTGNVNGPLIIDGVTLAIGQAGERVLVAGEATQANDGWYTITQVGVIAVSPYILTRATESDQAAEIGAGYLTGVVAPNTVTPGANNGKLYISVCADPFVVGTTALTFSQVGGTYSAGNGLTLSGSVFTIDTAITVDKTTAQTLTNKTIGVSQLSGQVAVANGGTGSATAAAARTALGLDTGWLADTNTWTYASATTFTIAADATGYLPKGTKVSYNDGAVDYGHVAAVAFAAGTTTVTLITNTDYTIANATLTAPRYSYEASPQGFPTWFNWSPTLTGWGATPPTNIVHRYTCVGTAITMSIRHTTNGTSTSATHTGSLPVTAATITNGFWLGTCVATDNNVVQAGSLTVASAGVNVSMNGILATSNNTASGNSRINGGTLTYEF